MRFLPSLASSFLSCVGAASAAGPTNEEEAIGDLNAGRFPLVITSDSMWRVHVDADRVLHRVRLDDPSIEEQVRLPSLARELSTSRSGLKTAFIDSRGCIGVVTFNLKGKQTLTQGGLPQPKLDWVQTPTPPPGTKADSSCAQASAEEETEREYKFFPIALSGDGERVALAGPEWTVQIMDVASRKIVQELPADPNSMISHLRFLDQDKKLLVVMAMLGEAWEAESGASDMRFSVWDLKKREIANFYSTGTTGSLLPYDLLWSLTEQTGDLWVINTNGEYWAGPERRAAIEPHLLNLKGCRMSPVRQLRIAAGEGDEWLGFAVDPYDRWIAYVESVRRAKGAGARLHVLDSHSGKEIAVFDHDAELHSVTPSPDGLKLYAVTAGQPKSEELRYTRVAWEFKGGGKVVAFDIGPQVQGLARASLTSWSGSRCLIEDEMPDARDVVQAAPSKLLFAVELEDNQGRATADGSLPRGCYGDDQTSGLAFGRPLSRKWGLTSDGGIWIDAWTELQRLSPESGDVLQSIPTPRERLNK